MTRNADAGILALDLVDETLRSIALAIEREINVRQCAHDPADGIDALRWCLALVTEA
jgi:hypothetical protein